MMDFDPVYQPFQSSRYTVTASRGMVASSSAMASNAGLDMLKMGGNAVDAAVAAAAVLSVTEPTSNGIGGDAFAIVWMKDKLYGLNGSGTAPQKLSIETLKAQGIDKIPEHGWIPVMIPGQPRAWAELIHRFGKLTMKQVLAPAIHYAEEGYAVSPVLSYLWGKYVAKNKEEYKKSDVYKNWLKTFTKDGEPYKFGEIVRFPDHARTMRLIAESDSESFYSGKIAEAIVRQSDRDGGYISIEDLKNYHCDWVEPISVNYRGYDVWELPPNGQGLVTLLTLNILKNQTFDSNDEIGKYHTLFEAMKIAFEDGISIITDPSCMKENYRDYLTDAYGKQRYIDIDSRAKTYMPYNPFKSGTVYLCTADNEGNMVSYIQSNYHDFGSGIVIEDYGVSLQNRGFDFSLNPQDANCLKPGKKSYHTIIPGFLSKDSKAVGPFGVMGGYMQPQGHVQVLTNMIDFHLNPQMALDAPRWQWTKGKEFLVEPEFDKRVADELIRKGHEIKYAANRYSFGRGQIIQRLDNGVLIGGTESRTDSNIACY